MYTRVSWDLRLETGCIKVTKRAAAGWKDQNLGIAIEYILPMRCLLAQKQAKRHPWSTTVASAVGPPPAYTRQCQHRFSSFPWALASQPLVSKKDERGKGEEKRWQTVARSIDPSMEKWERQINGGQWDCICCTAAYTKGSKARVLNW
jgi:hypothetical protein